MSALAHSFAPISAPDARVLVLGSMPGVASLEAQQYYAHPRNAFWPIMGELFGFDVAANYPERCTHLRESGVAVWDVLRACRREGSLDSAIDRDSEEPNDFAAFFSEYPKVRLVAFNGQKAQTAFRQHVTLSLGQAVVERLAFVRVPSTSPAHATQSFEQKLDAWRCGLGV